MEPTYFYTRLPQALGILPQYSVYNRARELRLSEFVFGIDHVRWIVWRSAWERLPAMPLMMSCGKLPVVAAESRSSWKQRKQCSKTAKPSICTGLETAVICSLGPKNSPLRRSRAWTGRASNPAILPSFIFSGEVPFLNAVQNRL